MKLSFLVAVFSLFVHGPAKAQNLCERMTHSKSGNERIQFLGSNPENAFEIPAGGKILSVSKDCQWFLFQNEDNIELVSIDVQNESFKSHVLKTKATEPKVRDGAVYQGSVDSDEGRTYIAIFKRGTNVFSLYAYDLKQSRYSFNELIEVPSNYSHLQRELRELKKFGKFLLILTSSEVVVFDTTTYENFNVQVDGKLDLTSFVLNDSTDEIIFKASKWVNGGLTESIYALNTKLKSSVMIQDMGYVASYEKYRISYAGNTLLINNLSKYFFYQRLGSLSFKLINKWDDLGIAYTPHLSQDGTFVCLADRKTTETWSAGYSSLAQNFQKPVWTDESFNQHGWPDNVWLDDKSRSCVYVKRPSNYGENHYKTTLARTAVDTGNAEDLLELMDGQLRVDNNGTVKFVGQQISTPFGIPHKTMQIVSGSLLEPLSKWNIHSLTTKQTWEGYQLLTDDLVQFSLVQNSNGQYPNEHYFALLAFERPLLVGLIGTSFWRRRDIITAFLS